MDKSTLKLVIGALAISTGLGAAALQAQDAQPAPAGPGAHQPMGGKGPMSFQSLDVDGSGEITASDLEALKAKRFAELDTNGDGQVSKAEFIAHAEAQAAERATKMFDRLDADHNGFLSQDLIEAMGGRGGEMGDRILARLDTDKSGGVSEAEYDAGLKRLAQMRKDHPGGGRMGDREGGRGWFGNRH